MRVQLVEGEYRLVFPPEVVEKLKLKDGDPVEVQTVIPAARIENRNMTMLEGLTAYRTFEAEHHDTFVELAK